MESLFDFNQAQQSPLTSSASAAMNNDAFSAYGESQQHFNAPSHDYGQFKQQVGFQLDNNGMSTGHMNAGGMDYGFNSGFSEMDFMAGGSAATYGFNSGLDYDADMSLDFTGASGMSNAMYMPQSSIELGSNMVPMDYINPNTLAGNVVPDELSGNVGRLWPGVHSEKAQQAAMAKAAQQAQAQATAAAAAQHHAQQRQMKMQTPMRQSVASQGSSSASSSQPSQPQMQQAPTSNANSKRPAGPNAVEPHVEESISRLLNQMRQANNVNGGGSDDEDEDGPHSHMARMKKDDEDMDEDERLLASEEGKKLSSKERRQLRNKVSARAFRSRRKEYIGQLESEIALRTQESSVLRSENSSLRQENERYRGLIETLLRHPAFTPFINDISKDPSLLGVPNQHVLEHQQQQQQQQKNRQRGGKQEGQNQQGQQNPKGEQQPSQQDGGEQQSSNMTPEYMNFDAAQLQIPSSSNHQEHINLARIPSEHDFSKLNLSAGFPPTSFHSVGAYLVLDVPQNPEASLIGGMAEEQTGLWEKLGAAAERLAARDAFTV